MSIPVGIIVLDKPRNIKFGYRGLITAQVLTGKKTLEILNSAALMDIDVLSKVLYAGLQHEDKSLTLDKLIDLVDENAENVAYVIKITTDILCKSIGVKIDEDNLKEEAQEDPNVTGPIVGM